MVTPGPLPVAAASSPTWARALAGNANAADANAASATIVAMAERIFIKFTFLKIDPAWQRREHRGARSG